MTYSKVIELFAESIPGAIIQLMAIVTSTDTVSPTAWISLTASALATGFISASISYDWDTDPSKRSERPSFYGFIPAKASKRTVCFAAMLLLSTGMLLVRAYTIVLLALLGKRWVFGFFILDIILYLAIKIVRKEFWYWMATGTYSSHMAFSLATRIIGKIVLDFTSLVQFRHPFEFGGALWSFNLILSMASFPISLYILQANGSVNHLEVVEQGWLHCLILVPSVVLTFVILLYTIDQDFLSTFISPMNTRDFLASSFREAKSDRARAQNFFSITKKYWDSTEDEARYWVAQNWDRWELEKPPWLNEVMRESIPLDFIPKGRSQKNESIRRQSERKSQMEAKRRFKSIKKNKSVTPVVPATRDTRSAERVRTSTDTATHEFQLVVT